MRFNLQILWVKTLLAKNKKLLRNNLQKIKKYRPITYKKVKGIVG